MDIIVEICLMVFRVPYICIASTPKPVLISSGISKILSEREQIPLQSSHTKYVVKTWISISCNTVNRTFHSYSHLYHPVYNLYAYTRLKRRCRLKSINLQDSLLPIPTSFPGSLSSPSHSVWMGKREPWERGWKSINHEQWDLMDLWVESSFQKSLQYQCFSQWCITKWVRQFPVFLLISPQHHLYRAHQRYLYTWKS